MTILESLEWRYATKSFDTNYTLSDTEINILKNAFNLTATSFGLQPIKLVIVKDRERREKLLPHAFNQKQVIEASHLLIICIQKNSTVQDVENYFDLVKKIRKTPDEILAPFKDYLLGHFSKTSQEDLSKSAKSQAYIALGNLLTVCATQQIDSCPMEGFIPQKFDEILELNKHNLSATLLLPVGKRAANDYMADLKKVRKPLDQMILEI